jgi:transglutaminase-like putative cysteine protease
MSYSTSYSTLYSTFCFFAMSVHLNNYLQPTPFLDSDHASVIAFAETHTLGASDDISRSVQLYYAVRDGFFYNPYQIDLRPEGLKASSLLTRTSGYCVEKAVLLAAAARVVGIPSRLSFFNVRNHIATEKLERVLQTNLLVFHGAAELWLGGKWVKTTPAFNAALCHKLNVETLEFDGKNDSVFQQFDRTGNTFMHYEHEYGAFADLPYDLYISELRRYYGHVLSSAMAKESGLKLDLSHIA